MLYFLEMFLFTFEKPVIVQIIKNLMVHLNKGGLLVWDLQNHSQIQAI